MLDFGKLSDPCAKQVHDIIHVYPDGYKMMLSPLFVYLKEKMTRLIQKSEVMTRLIQIF